MIGGWFKLTLYDKKSIKDYTDAMTEAAKCALVELWIALEEYHDDIAVIGGWAPYFLTQGSNFKHCGTEDIDLVVRTGIPVSGKSICEILKDLRYVTGGCVDWRFSKCMTSPIDGREYKIQLDFICERKDPRKYEKGRPIQKKQKGPEASAYL